MAERDERRRRAVLDCRNFYVAAAHLRNAYVELKKVNEGVTTGTHAHAARAAVAGITAVAQEIDRLDGALERIAKDFEIGEAEYRD